MVWNIKLERFNYKTYKTFIYTCYPVLYIIFIYLFRSDYDTSNFATYPDSTELPDAVKP